jgi:exopolyphosphatase/guanosine-5'-triphosphate,3'-diphosphate pyrophosphatase
MRARHAYEWAMDKRWVGLDPAGRARIAAALLAAGGKVAPPPELERLAPWDRLREAVGWGLAIRLSRRLGAGSRASLLASELRRDKDKLVLWVHPSRAQLASDNVANDLRALAQWLGLEPEMVIGEKAETEPA